MCNDYGNRIPYSEYIEAFSHLKISLFARGGPPNLEPRDDIWPTDLAPIIRAAAEAAELIQLKWGFPSGRPKGPPVINMRSEGRKTNGDLPEEGTSGSALAPARPRFCNMG